MAALTTRQRHKLPASAFAEAGRRYPVPDRAHAANAKARAAQAVKAGRMSQSQQSAIDAKANRVLGKGHYSVKNASSHEGKLAHG